MLYLDIKSDCGLPSMLFPLLSRIAEVEAMNTSHWMTIAACIGIYVAPYEYGSKSNPEYNSVAKLSLSSVMKLVISLSSNI